MTESARDIASNLKQLETDVLIIGSGGAGLLAAIHAYDKNPKISVTIASKGLIGKSGCTRMVQGGYNVALAQGDSIEKHFDDTIRGGAWINDQELAWTLVSTAFERVLELENRYGCFFDRNPDGSIHQKAFAGQSFDRTVHKGDLTGIEIMNRLMEHVRERPVRLLEETRAIDLIPSSHGNSIAAALFLDIRTGEFFLIRAKVIVVATGAGPTMFKFHTPSGDKSCDGLAMALRLGLNLRDMEMVQFHPTGLLAGPDTRITGTIIEEGLRGAGGHLLDGEGQRFMCHYDDRNERATRDIVSRAMMEQMRAGATGPNGGVFLSMKHLPADEVASRFKGMVQRCADVGFDLISGLVEVTPTAHYIMGGIEISPDCQTAMPGLLAAGEDTGGVHGANRLGGNGVGNATVFGGIAGDTAADSINADTEFRAADADAIAKSISRALAPLSQRQGNLNQIRENLYDCMWEHAGILRSAASLSIADAVLSELDGQLRQVGVHSGQKAFNMSWQDHLNLQNQILVSQSIVLASQTRNDSRGAHYLIDHPATGSLADSRYTRVAMKQEKLDAETVKVKFTRLHPDTES